MMICQEEITVRMKLRILKIKKFLLICSWLRFRVIFSSFENGVLLHVRFCHIQRISIVQRSSFCYRVGSGKCLFEISGALRTVKRHWCWTVLQGKCIPDLLLCGVDDYGCPFGVGTMCYRANGQPCVN
jgi:hypothetical protein